ncbi:hypothetical protein AKO1_002329 [Acrasis kona]|uniref:Uncharacterized protein n=1 Tax=Acrasis kona TaxID=1008807 RepID=A0AAW2YUQ0_9EUKA
MQSTARYKMSQSLSTISRTNIIRLILVCTFLVTTAYLFLKNNKERRVISFGLYGTNPKYTVGAVRNVQIAKYIYPDWVCRFYVDLTVPPEIIDALKKEGAQIIVVESDIKGKIAGMFWRFLVADDRSVDRYIVRDTDSRLSLRESTAVNEWIKSGENFHIMKDHPYHGSHKILGGLWGGTKNGIGASLAKFTNEWKNRDTYLDDMELLQNKVWPLIEHSHISHDSYFCESDPRARPFPLKRMGDEHVGQVFDEFDKPRESDCKPLRETASPMRCRARPDWERG